MLERMKREIKGKRKIGKGRCTEEEKKLKRKSNKRTFTSSTVISKPHVWSVARHKFIYGKLL